MHAFINTYRTELLKWAHFLIHKLYLNKDNLKLSQLTFNMPAKIGNLEKNNPFIRATKIKNYLERNLPKVYNPYVWTNVCVCSYSQSTCA